MSALGEPGRRKRRTMAVALPWAIAVADVALFGGAMIVAIVAGSANLNGEGLPLIITVLIAELGFIGALLATRVPGNVIGPWLLAAATLASVGWTSTALAAGLSQSPARPPIAGWAALVGDLLYFYPIFIVLIVVPLLFPTGRLLSARWRWLLVVTAAGVGAYTIGSLFRPGPVNNTTLDNPLGSPSLAPLVEWLDRVTIAILLSFVGAAVSVVVRYRRSSGVVRQQLRWLVAVVVFAVSTLSAGALLPSDPLFLIGFMGFTALPLAIGIAILRYRLYDIDRIISRTISWALVTGVLLLVFAATVVGLQGLLQDFTQGDTLAVAGSTLLAITLFQPLRRGIQTTVDRRFDRGRYDRDRVVERFNDRLRYDVDLESVASEVRRAAEETVRPTTSAVWIRIVRHHPTTAGP